MTFPTETLDRKVWTLKVAKYVLTDLHKIGTMLNKLEIWYNIRKSDIEALEKPDTVTQRLIFKNKGNPRRVFMCLDFRVWYYSC